jgi:hypothetical protein
MDELLKGQIMTEGEMQKYGKRLWALQEKGFTVKVAA